MELKDKSNVFITESKFLSNNLFSSMINTGKMIAEKLKNNIGKE